MAAHLSMVGQNVIIPGRNELLFKGLATGSQILTEKIEDALVIGHDDWAFFHKVLGVPEVPLEPEQVIQHGSQDVGDKPNRKTLLQKVILLKCM